jgi:hypothetical protein
LYFQKLKDSLNTLKILCWCGDPAYHCMCSMQVVDITPIKHRLTSITSIRVVQQKHRRSKVGA